ncbi:MAG: AMP-binding protein [Ignavibacteriota bacterium]|nr:MAG: long-chain fatty acid--CoA ligase [Chlorobiota bacterium]MBE7475281.1 AMP-binding protein [Ignavibacteriales bacterium]MBL1122248.1 long-chain fatty acid--CoA ligase [Ignavibacteriota bacterium]MBV6421670.1 Long-chain-fatty-acid--CoA ligase [Ignavibacteriaceae bacterium]MCE7855403.1 long-chain fatty acid--CoA ligase [Ignavibacteria bacterium CHB3]MEB2296568.1 AMP-binding protein [Ignavibacteria bacterium]
MNSNQNKLQLFEVPQIESIQDMFLKSADKFSNKLAMEDLTNYPISKVTYSKLNEYIIKFGSSLQKLGIKPRDHIAVIGENRVQWAIAFLAGMMYDFVIVPVDKGLTPGDILNIIHESDATALIFSGSLSDFIKEKKNILAKVKFYISMDLDRKQEDFYSMLELIKSEKSNGTNLPKINPDDVAEIIYTSGSLGRAKGVMLTQRNISSNLVAMRQMITIYPEDRFLGVLPIHHTYQCTCGLLCPLYSGSSVHFARSLKTIPEDMAASKPTILLGAPLLYNKMYSKIIKNISAKKTTSILFNVMMNLSDLTKRFGWKNSKKVFFGKVHRTLGGSMRLLIAGGAAPDPKVSKFFRELGFNIIQGYGLTETSPILALNKIEYFKDDAAGLPLPGVEIIINQPDKNGVGEIIARGPSVMPGYYNNPSATKETFDNGWFKTGDLGYFDEEGFLFVCGRKKNVIIANNGENVYPEEIEDILNRNQFVLESMVYGEEDEKHNERIVALIVPDTSAFIEYSNKNNVQINPELIDNLISQAVKETNKQLPAFKQIRNFYIHEHELEKTTTQKVKRYAVNVKERTIV